MCFSLEDPSYLPKISNKPITCYKVMIKDSLAYVLYSLIYSGTGWKLNEVYTARLQGSEIDSLLVESEDEGWTVNAGFHSYKSSSSFKKHQWVNERKVRVGCEIPANTQYFENDSEYVSHKIIFKKIIEEV